MLRMRWYVCMLRMRGQPRTPMGGTTSHTPQFLWIKRGGAGRSPPGPGKGR